MNAIGNIFKWFKKGKGGEILIDDDNLDNHSDEIVSSREPSPSGKSDEDHGKIGSPTTFIITP